jgi:hypothetical protein
MAFGFHTNLHILIDPSAGLPGQTGALAPIFRLCLT